MSRRKPGGNEVFEGYSDKIGEAPAAELCDPGSPFMAPQAQRYLIDALYRHKVPVLLTGQYLTLARELLATHRPTPAQRKTCRPSEIAMVMGEAQMLVDSFQRPLVSLAAREWQIVTQVLACYALTHKTERRAISALRVWARIKDHLAADRVVAGYREWCQRLLDVYEERTKMEAEVKRVEKEQRAALGDMLSRQSAMAKQLTEPGGEE